MRTTPAPRCVLDARATLGEGPVWDAARAALWWIDCAAPSLHRFDPVRGADESWPMPCPVGCVVPSARGDLVLARADGFVRFDPRSGATAPIADPEAHRPANVFNDGKADPRGRLWAGTVGAAYPETDPVGALYRLDPDGRCSCHAEGFICPNGLGWSPDGRTMYVTDSNPGVIWAYPFDMESGTLGGRRTLYRSALPGASPDGLAVDAEGCIWSAHWNGSAVLRIAPDGRVVGSVPIPCAKPTSCAFGGPGLATLYVTSARFDTAEDVLRANPTSGGVFAFAPGVAGMRVDAFAG